MSLEKKERNRNLYLYHQKHPDTAIAAIARMFHIPRQVAWEVIKREKAKEDGDETLQP